jgi:hypothetical protein
VIFRNDEHNDDAYHRSIVYLFEIIIYLLIKYCAMCCIAVTIKYLKVLSTMLSISLSTALWIPFVSPLKIEIFSYSWQFSEIFIIRIMPGGTALSGMPAFSWMSNEDCWKERGAGWSDFLVPPTSP